MIYANSSLSLEEKIKNEKRRRSQVYHTLDYVLSLVSYFDFFSADSFEIAKTSLGLTLMNNEEKVSPEIFFLSFFDPSLDISLFFKQAELNPQFVLKDFPTLYKPKRIGRFFNFLKKNVEKGIKFLGFPKKKSEKEIDFSSEVSKIFDIASEDAVKRFKTPVITPEILFITLMEQKHLKVSKLLRKQFNSTGDWYYFRYELMKRIHYQEVFIRTEIPKSQHFFAYLLKTQLKESEFNQLIETELLEKAISVFRNTLVINILKIDLFDLLKKDIRRSMHIFRTRKYSS